MKSSNWATLYLLFFLKATCHAFKAIHNNAVVTRTPRSPPLFAVKLSDVSVDRRKALMSLVALPLLLPSPALAGNPKARIDVNNALAREYTAFPGLFPTVATKVVKGAPYTSKKDVYAVLNEVEAQRLKEYDSLIVINKVDKQLQQFKTSQIWYVVCSCGLCDVNSA